MDQWREGAVSEQYQETHVSDYVLDNVLDLSLMVLLVSLWKVSSSVWLDILPKNYMSVDIFMYRWIQYYQ